MCRPGFCGFGSCQARLAAFEMSALASSCDRQRDIEAGVVALVSCEVHLRDLEKTVASLSALVRASASVDLSGDSAAAPDVTAGAGTVSLAE